MIEKLNININLIQRIPIRFDPKPFIAGKIDVLPVYLIDQPIDLELNGIKLNKIDPEDYGISLAYGNLYFTTESFLENNPTIVKNFLIGATKGWTWAFQNRKDSINILSTYMKDANKESLYLKLESLFKFVSKEYPQYKGIFKMTQLKWEKTKDILTKFGKLDKNVKIENCYTNSFLNFSTME